MLSTVKGFFSINSGNPKNLYFFTGPDYSIKFRYLETLKSFYKNNVQEYDKVSDVLQIFKTKSLIPRPDCLYIVRYDKSFLSNPNKLEEFNKIKGTLVCLYDDDKQEEKLDKLFPDNVIRMNHLTKSQREKHLEDDYPKLSSIQVSNIAECCKDYYEACGVAYRISLLPQSLIGNFSKDDIQALTGTTSSYDSDTFKLCIAARNYKLAVQELDKYTGDYSLLLYDILTTMFDIIKQIEKPFSDTPYKKYVKLWSLNKCGKLFDIAYAQLKLLRNYSSYNSYNSLLYVCSLLLFEL